ncbi:MAG: cysteine--tRNA ligase [Planctomycetaceae bacterium]|nr:cysteine--tRNA ligase [Planctomycetaceae bacterium]
MALKLYNTLTRSKDEFVPVEPPAVRLYTCGPTVYNFAHIGNLRTYVFEDVLRRTLSVAGFDVRHVMNVTDVGHLVSDADAGADKMELGAAREGKSVWEIADFYWQAFRADLARLNIIEPVVWCKATDHIAEQIETVKTLEEKGFTYLAGDGVYFDTSKLPDYGKLAPDNIAGLQAGARVELVEGKRNPTDFALWKFSPKDQKRLMEWPSPWGVGFPGWHIECSAMAVKYLGERLDIHCGGIDHIAVHHTNEIAQAEAALGHKWCNWWMHGEFLTFGAKMSKSSGEFLTLQALIDKGYDPLAYRFFLLGAHYRQQLAFTWEGLDAAASAIKRLKRIVLDLRAAGGQGSPVAAHVEAFQAAAFDDLNMPQALAAMWAAAKDTAAPPADVYATLLEMDRVLGLGFADMQEDTSAISDAEIERLIAERTAARKAKDFKRGDEIRKQLADLGVEIMDGAGGTTWRRG